MGYGDLGAKKGRGRWERAMMLPEDYLGLKRRS